MTFNSRWSGNGGLQNFVIRQAKHRSIDDIVRDPKVLCKPFERIIMKRFDYLMHHSVNHSVFDLRAIVTTGDHDFVALHKSLSLDDYAEFGRQPTLENCDGGHFD